MGAIKNLQIEFHEEAVDYAKLAVGAIGRLDIYAKHGRFSDIDCEECGFRVSMDDSQEAMLLHGDTCPECGGKVVCFTHVLNGEIERAIASTMVQLADRLLHKVLTMGVGVEDDAELL